MTREWDDIDAEAERVFGRTSQTKAMRYRKAMEKDPETKWAEAVKRTLENGQ